LDAYYKSLLEERSTFLLDLPFYAFGFELDDESDAQSIHEKYSDMTREVESVMPERVISYNVLWTANWFIFIPRSQMQFGPFNLK